MNSLKLAKGGQKLLMLCPSGSLNNTVAESQCGSDITSMTHYINDTSFSYNNTEDCSTMERIPLPAQ